MKKHLLSIILVLSMVFILTGCNNKEEKELFSNSEFTIICTTEKDESFGFENQDVITYAFDKYQYAVGYSVVTTQKFNNKDTYNEYKKAQIESSKDKSNKNISYDLKADDKKLTLVFTMTIKNFNAKTEEEKNELKASTILKSNEEKNVKCTLKGIKRSELK